MKKNLIEIEVNNYIESFKNFIQEDVEFIKELFDNDYSDEDFFWEIFKQQSLLNIAERGTPELTSEELSEVHRKMYLKSIIKTMEFLKTKGLIVGDYLEGYQLTDKGKKAINIPE